MESFILGIKKNVPVDVLIEIILKLPGISVINLCQTSKAFQNICYNYEDRIFSSIVYRDNFKKYESLSFKESYLKDFNEIGQPYILDVRENKCGYMIGNIARLPKRGELTNLGKDKAAFYIDSYLYKDLSLENYNKGMKYWVYGILGNGNVLSVSLKKNIYAVPLPGNSLVLERNDAKKRFPNNSEEMYNGKYSNNYHALIDFLQRDNCFLHVNDGEKETYLIHEITLG